MSTALRLFGLLLIAGIGVPACSSGTSSKIDAKVADTPVNEEVEPAWFEDVTDEMGLEFVHDCGPTGTFFMPHMMGSGCAVIRDSDGTMYLYLLQNAGASSKSVNRLYRRMPSGKFEDVTAGSGLGVAGWNMGVAIGDVNNDGRPDVLLTQYGGIKLFLNVGNGKFADSTEEAGLNNPLWACSAAFLDYNRDGWLDLVVVNYLDYDATMECFSIRGIRDFCPPTKFRGTAAKLFRNAGATATGKSGIRQPRFEDASFSSGIGRIPGPGLGVVCADFNNDGWTDVFVANDGTPNRLWINRHDGTFVDEAASRGVAYTSMGKAYAGMGVAVGDVNNDLMVDLYVTHLTTEMNTLWQQRSTGDFRDATVDSQLSSSRWRATGFGTLMADFNLDGALDIAVANGRVLRDGPAKNSSLGFWETYAERNQLFANDGTGKFRDISGSNPALCGAWNVARGMISLDFDDSGAPGLLVTTAGGRARLLRNVAPNRGHWLKIRAIDPKLNRDAYGAEVIIKAGREQLRLINPAQSYLSSGEPLALFGLGQSSHVESIRVKWPDGTSELFAGGAADRVIVLHKGEGRKP